MKQLLLRLIPVFIIITLCQPVSAQVNTDRESLKKAAKEQAAKEKSLTQQLQVLARQKGWPLVMKKADGVVAALVGIDEGGYPLYYTTQNNIIAAATIGTNKLWPGGISGLNLSGSSNNVKDKLAVWDGGSLRSTHVELSGRVAQRDNPSGISDHSTHVAGTMMAKGVNPFAKGMSFGLQEIVAYDYFSDGSEMLNEAANLLVSNHSYGTISGWYNNPNNSHWEWYGAVGATEDYKFGYYDSNTQLWDSIAYKAPYYLIVSAAGNNRNVNGPAVGSPYWRFNAGGDMVDAGNRPDGISNNDGYDIIPTKATAKNILTVGAVSPIPGGYSKAQDVVMSAFSSWGPTDDGRIKPDVVADGVNVLSSIGTSDNAYAAFSGTSMAAPNTSGSLLLLQEYYSKLHGGDFMRAASLKGLVIHTADEAGPAPGPDYQNGWGLVNIGKAAAVITANNTTQLIQENILNNGGTFTLPVIANGDGTISATISWTDPKATPVPFASALNNTSKRLINDLDIVVKKGATIFRPWVLNPASPALAATKGDNTIDNVEKVELTDVIPGEAYTIEVTHKGTLERGSQAYSLIVSGVGGTAFCASAATNTAGARIDSVSIGNTQKKNVAGCTSYNNYTDLITNLQPGQATPLFIRLASCDATAVDKIVKVFVDANNDGDFTDPGENIATSAVINGNGDYTTAITLPAGLTPGKYSILRIVMQETNTAANVTPCGSYTKGETQDYRIFINPPSNDVGVVELVNPVPANCASGEQYITVRIRNFGNTDKTAIPVTAVIKQGATTIATINETYPGPVAAANQTTYTLQTPFTSVAGATYTIAVNTNLAGDQLADNDKLTTEVTIAANPASPTGTAAICNTNAILRATNVIAGADYFWYNTSAATSAFATGSSVSTTTIPADKTYYLGTGFTGKVGLASKNLFPVPGGGYQALTTQAGNYLKYTSQVPLILENVRLFTKNPGTVTIIVGDISPAGNTYTPLTSKTIDVYSTNPNPAPGDWTATAADAADLGGVFNVDLLLPAGSHVIFVTAVGATVFRNNNVTGSPYPFTLPNVISITGNPATLAGDPNYFQNFYYYLYDMKVRTAGCVSPKTAIVATTATAPTITQSNNVLTSSATSGNQWYKDGVAIVGATSQTYTPTENGSYRVQVTDAVSNCTLESNAIVFTITAVPNVDPAEIALIVSPNPAPGQFTIQLETRTKADLGITLINTTGQKVYQLKLPAFTGRLSRLVNPGKLAAGVYYLEIHHDRKMYIKKVIITD